MQQVHGQRHYVLGADPAAEGCRACRKRMAQDITSPPEGTEPTSGWDIVCSCEF